MRNYAMLSQFGVLGLMSSLAGCTERVPLVAPSRVQEEARAIPPFSNPRTGNERLANSIPGFGGAFFKAGSFHVFLTDLTKQAVAAPSVARELTIHRRANTPVIYIQGQYTYLHLAALEKTLIPHLGGAVMLGIDSRRNRYWIVVQTDAHEARLWKLISDLRMPAGAFIIERGEPAEVVGTVSLTDKVRPVVGGLRVSVSATNGQAGSAGGTVWYSGQQYLLIASHVADSTLNGGAIGSAVYQPTIASGNAIGTVYSNPSFTTSNCVSGYRCGYDAALVAYSGGVNGTLGAIADPSGGPVTGGGSSGLTFDDSSPIITTDEGVSCSSGSGCFTMDFPGEEASKVGMVTGWTGGTLVSSTTLALGSDGMYRRNTYVVAGGVDDGDSGASVFSENQDRLAGVLWGKATVDGVTVFLYHNIFDVSENLTGSRFALHTSPSRIMGYEVRWIAECGQPYADNQRFYSIKGWADGNGGYDFTDRDLMGVGQHWCNGTFYSGDWQQSSEYISCSNLFAVPCPCAFHSSGTSSCPTLDPL